MTETTNFCLTTSQVISIYEINPNIKTILLVDDVIFNLKIICLKIIKTTDKTYKYDNFPILTNSEWQNYGIIIIKTTSCQYVLVANGMYGKEINEIIKLVIILFSFSLLLFKFFVNALILSND